MWLCLELAAEFIDFCLEDIAFGGCGGGLADSGGFFFLEAGSCFLGFGEFLAGDAFHAADFFREGSDVALEGGFAGGGIAAGVGMCEMLVRLKPAKARSGSLAHPGARPTIGLAAPLAALLKGS